jgi:hypothetical protein
MTFQGLFIAHDRSEEEKEWIDRELDEQRVRHQNIVRAMDDMTPTRDRWYSEFLDRIQTRGFNTDGDTRVKIKLEDIPVKPDRPHKVVY